MANYDVIEESGVVLNDICADRVTIHMQILIPISDSSGVLIVNCMIETSTSTNYQADTKERQTPLQKLQP